MYILKITNTVKNRDDLFVYDDPDVDFASLVQTFTDEALESIIKATLNEDLPINQKTFQKCAHVIDTQSHNYFTEVYVIEFLNRTLNASTDIFDEVKELMICSDENDFEAIGEIFVENGINNKAGNFSYYISWTIYDNNIYEYELFFQTPNQTINIVLKHKDGFDTPPSELSLTI